MERVLSGRTNLKVKGRKVSGRSDQAQLRLSMASGGLPDEAARRIEETRQKVKEHWEKNRRVWVDQDCVSECWNRISPWLDIPALYPHLVTLGIANSDDDYYHLLGNHPPGKVKNHLLHELLPRISDYGPYLFYMCLLKSAAGGNLGHSSAAQELKSVGLRKRSPVPPAISGEADPMDRDGQNRGDGGGRGRGGSGGGGRRPPPYQPSSQQMVAQPQSSLESGRHSLVVAKGSSVEQGIGDLSLSSNDSSLNDSMSYVQPLSAQGSPPPSLDPYVERDRPRGQPHPPSQQPSLASSGGVSLQSSGASPSSLQSHRGFIAQDTEQAGESAQGVVRRHIQCGKYSSVVDFQREKCDIAFALRHDCTTTDSFISCVRKFIVASLNSRHQQSCAILVAGIDEDSCQPFPLAFDCQRLTSSRLHHLIFCRDSPEGKEVPLSREQADQISLTFITPQQTGQPSQPAPSPVAMVAVCPTPAACRSCIFTYRDYPTSRGEVWRRAEGHSVKVERPRELRRLHDQLAAQYNNCPPSHPNMQ